MNVRIDEHSIIYSEAFDHFLIIVVVLFKDLLSIGFTKLDDHLFLLLISWYTLNFIAMCLPDNLYFISSSLNGCDGPEQNDVLNDLAKITF